MFKSYELTLVTDTLYNCVNGLETSRVKHNHSPGQKTKSQSTLRQTGITENAVTRNTEETAMTFTSIKYIYIAMHILYTWTT